VSEQSGIEEDETTENPREEQLPADDGFGRPDIRQLEIEREMWRYRLMAIGQAALKTLHPKCRVGAVSVDTVSAGVVERGSRGVCSDVCVCEAAGAGKDSAWAAVEVCGGAHGGGVTRSRFVLDGFPQWS
jgi:hypothetical protein